MAMAPTFPSDTAVLLVNLGTPGAPTAAAVRRYLSEFLMDPRVVQLPRLVWWPLLHGLVLPLRSARVARKYAQVWMPGGSPLAVHTAALASASVLRKVVIASDGAPPARPSKTIRGVVPAP